MRRRRAASLLLAGTALVTTGVVVLPSGAGDLAQPAAAAALPHDRNLLWLANGKWPEPSDIRAAAGRFSIVVFNRDMVERAKLLRSLDPHVDILVYQDLSSVRSYDATPVAAPIGYQEAVAADWIAKDTFNKPIAWTGYSGHYQTKVWLSAYQQKWTDRVTRLARQEPWDGIFADNDYDTLQHYSRSLLGATSSAAETDAKLRSGLNTLITKAGSSLVAHGKLFVPNISEGRRFPDRWVSHTRYGGGLEENFMSWSTTAWAPSLYDWGSTGWIAQMKQVAIGPRTLAYTHAAVGDRRTQVYGYASFLLSAGPGDAWQSSRGTTPLPEIPPEANMRCGRPTSGPFMWGSAWTRWFTQGWVAVNPTQQTITIDPPAHARTPEGARLPQTLAPMTAVIGSW